jgi:hypothetical protein
MIEFKEIYNTIYSLDNSVYAGIALIATTVIGAGAIFYFGKKYCSKNTEKDKEGNLNKEGNLEKKV